MPFARTLLASLACVALAACSPPEPSEQAEAGDDSGAVLATLNGREIREADLEEWIRDELYANATADKDESALFEFQSESLDRMIDDQLIAAELEARGTDLEGLQREIVGEISISDAEVETFFETNKERMGSQTLETIGPRIREFLAQQTRGQAWQKYVAGLREAASVEVTLVAPRAEVAAVGPALGPTDAPVTIVEFSDFNCPFCQRVLPTIKTLRERYPEQVRIVFRHMPLAMHPRARPIAEASVCADEQHLFWPFHDQVFADGRAMDDATIRATAETAGLDLAAFDACLAAGRAASVVDRDMADARALGVTGTPAFFVNGIRLSGARPVEDFVELIEEELAGGSEADAS